MSLLLAAALLSIGCGRKAPGPDECQRLAARLLRIDDERLLRDPRVKQAFDRVTVECLTTPFDRKLVACVERGGDARVCVAEMAARRRERSR